MSQFLHAQLREGSLPEAQKPSGGFIIPCSDCPLVLISTGVGLTQMLSMLHTSAEYERLVWYVHGSNDRAMRRKVAALVSANHYATQHIAYSRPEKNDIQGQHFHSERRITADKLLALNAEPQAHYVLCGPANFLADIRNGLEAKGVAPEQIHFETFGPIG